MNSPGTSDEPAVHPHGVTRGHLPQREDERAWLANEMAGFLPETSAPWLFLTAQHGRRIRKEELVSLGQVCASELKLPLVREYKRRKETMLKWFHDHWLAIRPFLDAKVEIVVDADALSAYQQT
jgi:hypothetical protein